jgi:hypothetical protein
VILKQSSRRRQISPLQTLNRKERLALYFGSFLLGRELIVQLHVINPDTPAG